MAMGFNGYADTIKINEEFKINYRFIRSSVQALCFYSIVQEAKV